MKILFIQPNIEMQDTAVLMNHGITSLSSIARQEGCEVTLCIIDTALYKNKAYEQYVLNGPYDFIAVSSYSNQWRFTVEIAQRIKKISSVPIICGGPHATLFPKSLEESSDIDAFIVGEGEAALHEIIIRAKQGKPWHDIKGIWTKDERGTVTPNSVADRVEDLDSLPFPDYELYDRNVLLNYPGIIFSRGCPYLCSYCCNHTYRQLYKGYSAVRAMSPEKAVLLAQYYKDTIKPDHLDIDDDTFTKNRQWLASFLKLYKDNVNLPFNCNARTETINHEIAAMLKAAGCETVSIGIESGNEELRRTILKRDMSNEEIIEKCGILKQAGLKVSTFNMVGVPGETWMSYKETVALNQRIQPEHVQITVYYPFKGTELGDYCYDQCLVQKGLDAGSYFGPSILKISGFPKWRIKLAHRTFKFFVYKQFDVKRACYELVKDFVKALPCSHVLIPPYLKTKKMLKKYFS